MIHFFSLNILIASVEHQTYFDPNDFFFLFSLVLFIPEKITNSDLCAERLSPTLLVKMKWLAVFCLCFCVFLNGQTNVNGFDLKDISKSAKDAVGGIVNKIPDVIPSPEDFFQSAKNVIAGYPFDIAAKLINMFCKFFLLYKSAKAKKFSLMI